MKKKWLFVWLAFALMCGNSFAFADVVEGAIQNSVEANKSDPNDIDVIAQQPEVQKLIIRVRNHLDQFGSFAFCDKATELMNGLLLIVDRPYRVTQLTISGDGQKACIAIEKR